MFYTNVPTVSTETGDNIIYPFSPPIFQTEVDSNFTNQLIVEGRKLTKEEDDWNYQLAGNLKYGRSYRFKESFKLRSETYLKIYVKRFCDGIDKLYGNSLMTDKITPLKLDELWINFSQKHDFNPPHAHSGVLSFVIFCKVPPEIFKTQADSNNQSAGKITFSYGENITSLMGNDYPIEPYENLMFIFPAQLKHYVSPYWVDAERISVSGNFSLSK
jgi:hypothetical protein